MFDRIGQKQQKQGKESWFVNLEKTLQEQEQQVDALLKAASRYVASLKAWKKACQSGHLTNRQKAAAAAQEMAPELAAPTRQVAESWDFDTRAYLEEEHWRKELQAAAEKHGLRVFEEGDNLVSSPVVVRAQPGRGSLALGKVNWPMIHPQVAAAELRRLRDRTSSANSQEFADCLFAACQRLSQEANPFAKFRDIYEQFCLAPGWKKENTPAAFGQAIYALHRSEIRTTRSGRKFDFEYPSGNVRDRDIFPVIAEDGRAIRYYGIQFR